MAKLKKEVFMVYKFVKWDVPALAELSNSWIYHVYEKAIVRKEKLTRDEKGRLYRELASNSRSKLGVPLQGWMFVFTPILKRYLCKSYDMWEECFAPDKTSIRTWYTKYSEIVEIPQKGKGR